MVTIDGLRKVYGDVIAVNNLSFSVASGEVVGFLGPNGAGKSTTMRMISGFIMPNAGRITVMGHDVQSSPLLAKKQIGYLPEGAPAYGDMTTAQFLRFVAAARGQSRAQLRQSVDNTLERLGLVDIQHRLIDNLSKGFKRRVGLAAAIIDDPKVLILDEPTDGLDPNQKFEVRALIQSLAKDKIIIVSTHILEEVEAVCTRAMVINKGRLVVDQTPTKLMQSSRFHNAVKINALSDKAFKAKLENLPTVSSVEINGEDLIIFADNDPTLAATVAKLAEQDGLSHKGCHTLSGRLDDVFRQLTAGEAA